MTAAQHTAAMTQLSKLLGVQVVSVVRRRPAHERAGVWLDEDGRVAWGPARDLQGRVVGETWRVKVVDPSGADSPITGRCLTLSFESRQVRDGRELTHTLRRIGSAAALNNRSARRCLALMHRAIEGGNK